jgi:hypothetical protein
MLVGAGEGDVDPITMAAAGAAALFAKKVVEELGSQAGKSLSAAAGRLVEWLRRRGDEDSETAAALTMVQTRPNDQTRIGLLRQVLADRAAREPEFAEQLQRLVGEADHAGDVQVTIGGAHIHGGVYDEATVNQAGRDQIQVRLDPQ